MSLTSYEANLIDRLKADNESLRQRLAEAEQEKRDALIRAEAAESRLSALQTALAAIKTAVRGDEKSECWTIRKWLDEHDVFNDDLSSVERLVDAVVDAILRETAS